MPKKIFLYHTWRTKYTATSQARHRKFAVFLTQIPLPQRIFFRFDDITKSGVPLQNIVRGGLQKHLNISEIKITSQRDGVDVQFVKPQEPWLSKPNLKRRFK